MPTEFTEGAPSTVKEYMGVFKTRVRLGLQEGYASLEVSSNIYSATYDYASIGLQSGATESIDVGALASISSNISAELEEVEVANVPGLGLDIITDETATVSMEIMEWKPEVLAALVITGSSQAVNTDEYLIRFGGGCTVIYRPLELFSENIACFAPTSEDVTAGISGIVITFYRGRFTSGLDTGDLSATGQPNAISAEYEAGEWTDRATGNQIGNIYMY